MNDRPRRFSAMRWPSPSRVIISCDPEKEKFEPGDVVNVDGALWVVERSAPIKQVELIVKECSR